MQWIFWVYQKRKTKTNQSDSIWQHFRLNRLLNQKINLNSQTLNSKWTLWFWKRRLAKKYIQRTEHLLTMYIWKQRCLREDYDLQKIACEFTVQMAANAGCIPVRERLWFYASTYIILYKHLNPISEMPSLHSRLHWDACLIGLVWRISSEARPHKLSYVTLSLYNPELLGAKQKTTLHTVLLSFSKNV